jgi:ABC-type bacteriocin/lantibiotic exporter with double-glycine peptidase domain
VTVYLVTLFFFVYYLLVIVILLLLFCFLVTAVEMAALREAVARLKEEMEKEG